MTNLSIIYISNGILKLSDRYHIMITLFRFRPLFFKRPLQLVLTQISKTFNKRPLY